MEAAKMNKKGQKLFFVVAEQTLWACLSIIEKGENPNHFPPLFNGLFYDCPGFLRLSLNKEAR